MARKRKRPEDLHTYLSIVIEKFSVRSEASLNTNLVLDRPIFYDLEDPAHHFTTSLEVCGFCNSPKDREGDQYVFNFRGGDIYAGELDATLKDFQALDEHGAPVYKKYRRELIPVFTKPRGIATLDKRRGEGIWDAWITVKQSLVHDMLVTLTHIKPVYIAVHEKKEDRRRWVQSISLQSTNPEEE